MNHIKDSDCTVDPETDLCSVCGVEHGEPCHHCGAHAFHIPSCIVRVARGTLVVKDLERAAPPPGRFVAVKTAVIKGAETVARAKSKTMAKRIARALNEHQPTAEGV